MITPTREQAEEYLADYCRSIPAPNGRPLEYGYEIWIPRVIERYSAEEERRHPGFIHQPEQRQLWLAFYEAAWEFCRRGVLRPHMLLPRGSGAQGPSFGDGYSITTRGHEWLEQSRSGWYPTDPGRFIASLSRTSKLCGDAFTQRAHEAARCQDARLALACCAMCGAAAESILIAVATARLGDRDEVFRIYTGKDGRRRLLDQICTHLDGFLGRGIRPGFGVLAYWRDSAAHGQAETITDVEAEAALLTLYRLSMFVADNWKAITHER